MDVGWNFRREHLRLATRIHYVITNGGDQPNVVPPNAAVWYYYREVDYDHIMHLWDIGDKMAQAGALMTDTTWTSRVLGTAWPGHFNVPIAEAVYANIQKVGMPQWSEADQTLAKALQKELKQPERGLSIRIPAQRPQRALRWRLRRTRATTVEAAAGVVVSRPAADRTISETFPGPCLR